MFSLHQLRCFLATYEHGSLTAAAEELGYAQPSLSEQVRSLEKSLGVTLFRRVGRGMVPTTVADTFRPHAEATLAAADEARAGGASVRALETGTIRFGMSAPARLYAGAALIADVLERHPGVRVELIGQNSTDVQEQPRAPGGRDDRGAGGQRGAGGAAGGPRRAGLHQRRPRAAAHPVTAQRRPAPAWSCRRPPGAPRTPPG